MSTPWSVFQDGSNGEPAGRRQERQGATRARPRRSLGHPPRSQRRRSAGGIIRLACRLADSAAGRRLKSKGGPLSPSRDNDRWRIAAPIRFLPTISSTFDSLFKPLTEFTASIWAAFPNNPTRPTTPAARQGPAQRVVTLSGAPFHGTCAGSVAEDASETTIRTGEKPPILIPGSSPFAATRGILLVFPPDLGSHPSKASGSRRQPPGRGPLQSQALDTTSSHAGPGRAEPPLSAGRPWGKVFFSQPRQGGGRPPARPDDHHPPRRGGQQGTGGENTPGGRPGRCTLDLVASGATYAQRLDGSRDSAIHTKHRISPRSSSMRAKISAVESRLGYRGSRSPKVVVRGVRPPTVARSPTLSPPGAGSLTPGRGIRRALRLPRLPPLGIVVQLARLVAPLRGIDNDPSAGSVDFATLSGGRTANAAADPTLHRPFNR
ncbi:hypothetical protein H6P81_021710 [Aristolochia fimbriata]|uniref:Uncharacterized protein n=1 Tax=Aristolochia fimbriata TaxID=158543 RepID=A0AAV7DQX6_ARIFI|nr:hypothetical protein H6P81_021710 [Aristolochia fimbriata]